MKPTGNRFHASVHTFYFYKVSEHYAERELKVKTKLHDMIFTLRVSRFDFDTTTELVQKHAEPYSQLFYRWIDVSQLHTPHGA